MLRLVVIFSFGTILMLILLYLILKQCPKKTFLVLGDQLIPRVQAALTERDQQEGELPQQPASTAPGPPQVSC